MDLREKLDLEAADTITVPRKVSIVISSSVKPVKATFVNCQLGHCQYGKICDTRLNI